MIQAPTHRVIRAAALEQNLQLENRERLSCPFELKASLSKTIPSLFKYKNDHPEYRLPSLLEKCEPYRTLRMNIERLLFEEEKHVHFAFCDRCQKALVGTRNKCCVCNDFDLCDNCFGNSGQEWHQNKFIVKPEATNAEEDEDDGIKRIRRRNFLSSKAHDFAKIDVNVPSCLYDDKSFNDIGVDKFMYELHNWKQNKRGMQVGDLKLELETSESS